MSLSFEERKRKIIHWLEKEGKVQVRALATNLEVSDETIRRDLERLDKDGVLRKVYGGAIKMDKQPGELPFDIKTMLHWKEKKAISKKAAELVEDGDIVFVGNGTTPLEMVRFIAEKKNITLITPSLPALLLAMEVFTGRIIFIGGEFERNQKYTSGPLADGMIRYLKANKAFIAAGGISSNNGITDYDIEASDISRKMMERADETVILADHSKFGKTAFAYICGLSDVTILVTDSECPMEWKRLLAVNNINLLIAEE